MITAGSVRGKCSLASLGQTRIHPACDSTVGAPHIGQCVCRPCHSCKRDRRGQQGRRPGRRRLMRPPAASPHSADRPEPAAVTEKYGTSSTTPSSRRGASTPSLDAGSVSRSSTRPSRTTAHRRSPVRRDHDHPSSRPGVGQPLRVAAAIGCPVVRDRAQERGVLASRRLPVRHHPRQCRQGRRDAGRIADHHRHEPRRREELGGGRADLRRW